MTTGRDIENETVSRKEIWEEWCKSERIQKSFGGKFHQYIIYRELGGEALSMGFISMQQNDSSEYNKLKAKWDCSKELQAEFGDDFECYLAYFAKSKDFTVKLAGGIKD